MEIITRPYEISLWEDVLTFKYQTGEETEGQIENGHGPVVAQYYKENGCGIFARYKAFIWRDGDIQPVLHHIQKR